MKRKKTENALQILLDFGFSNTDFKSIPLVEELLVFDFGRRLENLEIACTNLPANNLISQLFFFCGSWKSFDRSCRSQAVGQLIKLLHFLLPFLLSSAFAFFLINFLRPFVPNHFSWFSCALQNTTLLSHVLILDIFFFFFKLRFIFITRSLRFRGLAYVQYSYSNAFTKIIVFMIKYLLLFIKYLFKLVII